MVTIVLWVEAVFTTFGIVAAANTVIILAGIIMYVLLQLIASDGLSLQQQLQIVLF